MLVSRNEGRVDVDVNFRCGVDAPDRGGRTCTASDGRLMTR